MAGSTNFGWQLFGTILCGLIFAIPIILVYFIVRWAMGLGERRKKKQEKQQTVI